MNAAAASSAYWTTEEVIGHLAISRDALMLLVHDAPKFDDIPDPWRLYAGIHGTRSARYRWSRVELDPWFSEVCRWRASTSSRTVGGRSAGRNEGEPAAAPSAASARRSAARSRSRTRSTVSGDTNLVELAERLRSE